MSDGMGWESESLHESGLPILSIEGMDGVQVINASAGDMPFGKNPVGAVAFYADREATYLVKGHDLMNYFKMFGVAFGANKVPVKVWISKNNEKVWPKNASFVELSPSNPSVEFPQLSVAMRAGDNIRFHVQGHPDNQWFNYIGMYPLLYDIGDYDPNLDPGGIPDFETVIEEDVLDALIVDEGNLPFLMLAENNLILEHNRTVIVRASAFDMMKRWDRAVEFKMSVGSVIVGREQFDELFTGDQDFRIDVVRSKKPKQLAEAAIEYEAELLDGLCDVSMKHGTAGLTSLGADFDVSLRLSDYEGTKEQLALCEAFGRSKTTKLTLTAYESGYATAKTKNIASYAIIETAKSASGPAAKSLNLILIVSLSIGAAAVIGTGGFFGVKFLIKKKKV